MAERRGGARGEPETTVFLHVPKAGGQTVRSVLGRIHGAGAIVDHRGALADDVVLDAPDWSQISLVEGHLVWGVQDQVPGPTAVFSILRDPADRVVSLHRYIRRTTEHRLHEAVRGMDLVAFLASGLADHEVQDAQVRQLSGRLHQTPDEATLDLALANVNTMAAVGIVEDLDRSLLVLRRRLGWPMPFSRSRNRATAPPAPLGADERAAVEGVTRLDQQLYDAAVRRLARDVEAAGPRLRAEFAALRAGNRVLGAVRR